MRTDSVLSVTTTARRDQITAAAIEVLDAQGFAAASVSAIAEHIGVSKGVLSYHFASKAELLGAVVDSVLADAQRWMAPRMGGATTFRAALQSYISANLSYLDSHRAAIRALIEVLSNARAVPGLSASFAASRQKAIDDLAGLFRRGQQAGEFAEVPAGVLARSLRATIDSVSDALHHDPDFDLAAFEHDLLLLFDRATTPASGTT